MRKGTTPRSTGGFSFTELVVAVAVLALCLLPILNLSTSTVRETSLSREDILARHLLMDLVERFRDSSIDELSRLPSSTSMSHLSPGQDDQEIAQDEILKERTDRLLGLVRPPALARPADSGSYGAIQRSVTISRLASFEKDKLGAGRHVLTCTVRWTSKTAREKKIEFSRVVIRS